MFTRQPAVKTALTLVIAAGLAAGCQTTDP